MKKTFAILTLVVSLSTLATGYAAKTHSSQENASSDREIVVDLTREFVSRNFGQAVAVVQEGVVDPKTGYGVTVINKSETSTHEPENIEVSIEGRRAIVTGRVIFKGQLLDGKSYSHAANLSVEYEKKEGQWQFVSGGVSSASEK